MRLTRAAVNTKLARLEQVAGADEAAGHCMVEARSREGADFLIEEGRRRGEIGPNDTIVILQRWTDAPSRFQPYRVVNFQITPILAGVTEPVIGPGWLDDLEHCEPAGSA